MARDTGLVSAVAGTQESTGDKAWSNLSNVIASDDAWCTASCANNETTHKLLIDFDTENFFSDANVIIYGIEAIVEVKTSAANSFDLYARWWDPIAPAWRSDQKTEVDLPAAEGDITFGGTVDDWGITQTTFIASCNAGRLHLGLWADCDFALGAIIYIDHVEVTIYYGIINIENIEQTITTQSIIGQHTLEEIEQIITLGSVLHISDLGPEHEHTVTFSDEMSLGLGGSIFNLSFTSNIGFWDKKRQFYEEDLDQTVTFTDEMAYGSFLTSVLTLTDECVGWAGRNEYSNLVLTQDFTIGKILNLIFSSTITLTHDQLTQKTDPDLYNYSPHNADSLLDQPPDSITFGVRDTLQLIGISTLIVKCPKFGDKTTIDPHRVLNKTRSGQYLPWRDTSKPALQDYEFVIPINDYSDYDALIDWLETNLGKQVTIDDGDNFRWTGVCLDPGIDQPHVGRKYWEVTIKIRGSKVAN